jgi:hypothetical protein
VAGKLVFVLFLFFIYTLSFAGEVISYRQGQVLINTSNEKYQLNQKLYIYNPETHQKIGIVVVKQKRPNQKTVIAELINGKVITGALVETATRNLASTNDVRIKYGIGLNLINSHLTVKAYNITTNMSGTGIGVDYTVMYPVYLQTTLLGTFGIHPVKLNNASTTGDNNYFDVTYLTGVGALKYRLNNRQTGNWIAFGSGLNIPYSKSSNILHANTITTNYSLNFTYGNDMEVNNKLVSLKVEYVIFPGENSSSTGITFSQIIFGFSYFL